MSIFYVNGEFLEESQARLPADDLAILRGFGVFDFLRSYGGIPFQLRAHLLRLQRSASLIQLACPWDIEELAEIALETLARNAIDGEAGIRLVLTGGSSANGFMPGGDSRLLVMVKPLQPLPAETYERGASVATVEQARDLPEAKTINYIPGITAQLKAQRRLPAAIEALYTVDGRVVEGTRSNIFVFKEGGWITPGRDLLPGITRAEVIKLLEAEDGLSVRDIGLEEFYAADEIILSSTTKELTPVVRVDDKIIGSGQPGPQSKSLMRRWREMTDAYVRAGIVV